MRELKLAPDQVAMTLMAYLLTIGMVFGFIISALWGFGPGNSLIVGVQASFALVITYTADRISTAGLNIEVYIKKVKRVLRKHILPIESDV